MHINRTYIGNSTAYLVYITLMNMKSISHRALIYKINNKGPSMAPCGTPCVIAMVADKVSL